MILANDNTNIIKQDKSGASVITVPPNSQDDAPIKDKLIVVGGQTLGLVSLLVLGWVSKNILQPKLSAAKRSLALPVETEHHINSLLGRILAESCASRVLIAQFHNGQNYYGGYSYSKLTITHETVDNGVATVAFNLREIPLSLYAEDLALVKKKAYDNEEFQELLPTNYVFITPNSFGDSKNSSTSKQRMLRMGVEGYYCFLLRGNVDKEERDIGAVFVQYNSLDKVRSINRKIEELVATIESHLVPHIESTNIFIKVLDKLGSLMKVSN
jgi:hypothetical protein